MLNLASKARPYFGAVVLTTALLVGGGIYSAMRMPSGIYPEVSFPRVQVIAKVSGLDVVSTEIQVTRPLEQAVSTVPGVEQVRSKTIRGASELEINFTPGIDMVRAEQLAWNYLGAASSELPKNIDLRVYRMTPSIFPILSVVLIGREDPTRLRDYAFYELAPRIKKIPDVLQAEVSGGDVREIEVEARPDDLLATGLSAADLADQLGKVHILEPVGRIERPPLSYQILVDTKVNSTYQIENLVLTSKNKQKITVRDVADVKVWHEDRIQSVGYKGRDAVVITILRSPGGNTVNISRDLQELLKNNHPPGGIEATVVYDQATFVKASVHNVRDAIIVGGLFSVLILLAFLRSWRATLISALAIPTTLAITFLFLRWTGETLNLMSLGGLAVAIGLIIDDTVVVIENIARHLSPEVQHGLPGAASRPKDPVDAASSEITGAVIGSSLTTVIVFVPLAFIVGVYGQFFASLTWALSIAVLVSMVISLTLVPVCAAKFLAGRPMPAPGWLYNFLADVYEKALNVALRFHWVTLALSLAAAGVGFVLFTGIPNFVTKQEPNKPPPTPWVKGVETGLMPEMDEGAFVLDYLAPSGTPLDRTEAMARKIEDILIRNPDVQSYVRRTGTELGIFATQSNRGDFQVILRPAPENPFSLLSQRVRPELSEVEKIMEDLGRQEASRKYGPNFTEVQMWEEGKKAVNRKYRRRAVRDIRDEVETEIKEQFSEHQLTVETVQIMQDELNDLSGASKPIEVKLFGPDYKELRNLATEVADKLANEESQGRGLRDINSSVHAGNPILKIKVDDARVADLGMTAADVQRQWQVMYLGQVATQVRESALRITDVRVRYPNRIRFGSGRFNPDQILNQWLLGPEKSMSSPLTSNSPFISLAGPSRAVPLAAVGTLDRVREPDEQWRENQQPAIFVTSDFNEKQTGLGTVVGNIRGLMGNIKMPAGYHWELGGHYLQQQAAFQSLLLVMVVAVLLVYIMLAFQFQSVLLPLTIFLTEPLSLVSGLFALWLTNTPLNVSSYMGAVLLIGLDMKNGILIVEYVQQLRREGLDLHSALLLAGRTRFRPILMTSLAAILGLFPLALGIGPGAQMQQPLAIMVIGGLTANMLFTRMVIPVGYMVLEKQKPIKVQSGPASSVP